MAKFIKQSKRNTADTVKLLKKNNGLKVDSVVDSEMLGVLFSDRAVGKKLRDELSREFRGKESIGIGVTVRGIETDTQRNSLLIICIKVE